MSTIKAARLTLDMDDDVVASSILDNLPPTKVIYKNTQWGLPNNVPKDNDSEKLPFKIEQTIKHTDIVEQATKIAKGNANLNANIVNMIQASADSKAIVPASSISNKKSAKTALITAPKEDNSRKVKFTLIDQEASIIFRYTLNL